jgi:hypothetical protein
VLLQNIHTHAHITHSATITQHTTTHNNTQQHTTTQNTRYQHSTDLVLPCPHSYTSWGCFNQMHRHRVARFWLAYNCLDGFGWRSCSVAVWSRCRGHLLSLHLVRYTSTGCCGRFMS